MKKLQIYEDYSREDVHSIFSPDTKFTPQAGTWGLQGIVKIPNREGDFVFFVTYGNKQADHEFDESISEDGVLSWQSQPSQGLSDKVIKSLINHDETVNSIFLFLRTSKNRQYSYLGKLKYSTHDAQREKPVYFQWQILDWEISNNKLSELGLNLTSSTFKATENIENDTAEKNTITESAPPLKKGKKDGVSTDQFQSRKITDYAAKDSKNRKLGLAGEELVFENEKMKLIAMGKNDLAMRVRHISKDEGDGAGYDILSFDEGGNEKFIEVKTTKGDKYSQFYASINEVRFSSMHSDSYYLYRLYNFNEELKSSDFFIVKGSLEDSVKLKPTQFKASFEL